MDTEQNSEQEDIRISCGDLRPGVIWTWLYQDVLQEKMPKQIDLLDMFFPHLFIEEVPSDGETKADAEYCDQDFLIHAVRYHGHFYIGGSRRVTQILGRLVGTARGSLTKEKNTAERIQKRAADILIESPEFLMQLRSCTEKKILEMTEAQFERFLTAVPSYTEAVISFRRGQTFDEQQSELFPIGNEVLEIVLTNAAYQWDLRTCDGVVNAFQWLLLGALLRPQLPRIASKYLSTFLPRVPDESDKFNRNGKPAELYYDGDDLDRRFPGIEFFCDRCGEYLNAQPGFDDHMHIWKCRKCGYKNKIEITEIYDSEKDWQSGADPVDQEQFFRALKERTDELDSRQ